MIVPIVPQYTCNLASSPVLPLFFLEREDWGRGYVRLHISVYYIYVFIYFNSIVSTPEKASHAAKERRSRIHSLINNQRESGDGMEAIEPMTTFVRTSRVMPQYERYTESGEEPDEVNNE